VEGIEGVGASLPGVSIPAGVELNRGSPKCFCGIDGSWGWIDEEADPDASLAET
jgi:hypothetical protein